MRPNPGVAVCPEGHFLISRGSDLPVNKGHTGHRFAGAIYIVGPYTQREQCVRHPDKTSFRQVMFFNKNQPSPMKVLDVMRRAIDSPRGRALYSKRVGTVEPVFANIRHNKRMNRFTLKGPMQSKHAVESLLLSAQHREDRE
jgi:Transposase DDE domain